MTNNLTSPQIRDHLIRALQLDLIGPTQEDSEYQEEILEQAPSQWYLTGFLVPYNAPIAQKTDDTRDEIAENTIFEGNSAEDQTLPETTFAKKSFFPSSMGLSLLISPATNQLNVIVQWGDYIIKTVEAESTLPANTEKTTKTKKDNILLTQWQRIPQQAEVTIDLNQDSQTIGLPKFPKLELSVSVHKVTENELIPHQTRSVSIFLVNKRPPTAEKPGDTKYTFQTTLIIRSEQPLIPRPNLQGVNNEDWDEKVADLQYRNDYEYAVGHNVSAIAQINSDGTCQQVSTSWLPRANVEKVIPTQLANIEIGMEALAAASTPAELQEMLSPMVTAYREWIQAQLSQCPQEPKRLKVAQDLLQRATIASDRIAAGINAFNHQDVFTAFCLANRVIATSLRQRITHGKDITPDSIAPPKWRPFQLAFLLMNLTGIAQPESREREIVDLLFFPTGGGKTEAYLGLAAFTLVLRRLRNSEIQSAGVSVLMRYTLRLLTLDQLGRATTMICALELERQKNPELLGQWPFEIGLWVGQGATPNRMGKKGDRDEHSAKKLTDDYKRDSHRNQPPIPLETCPWCGTKFNPQCFTLHPNVDQPTSLKVHCAKRSCDFSGNNFLPIIAVDETIYRRLPCFIISTVDKFASLPFVGATGALFGRVEYYKEKVGFYGPTEPSQGRRLKSYLPPPDLIIQDELHLISGPLGTMVGLYETAIEALCSFQTNKPTHNIRPKIVASTATVRRASKQIQALFCRPEVDIFPPPGPDRRDAFFAKTVAATEKNPRTYVGVAAQGRSAKVVLLRVYLALLSASQKYWLEAEGEKNPHNPADPYMTLLGYFNSLRELGGSRRIVEDEVVSRVPLYGQRLRVGETKGLFVNRKINDEPEELTSRVSTSKVADTKRRMELSFHNTEKIDVVLATNMISVGLDITRLGLMVVLGQPKTAAEYIQATSRVGRDEERPGLVVTLLNIHRPRDRSHYERFCAWHNTFYRAVEATSVTPFSPRAIDRGIAAITVALARLMHRGMTAPERAFQITDHRQELDFVIDIIGQRAEKHNPDLSPTEVAALRSKTENNVRELLDTWVAMVTDQQNPKTSLQYHQEVSQGLPLLFDPLDPELEKQPLAAKKFKAQRSLRDVEPSVNLWEEKLPS